MNWCKLIALTNGFSLVTGSKKYVTGNLGLRSYRGRIDDLENVLRKKTRTKKCRCPFSLNVVEIYLQGQEGTGWKTRPHSKTRMHNHLFDEFSDGHRERASLTEAEVVFVIEQLKAHVAPAKIMEGLHMRNPKKARPLKKKMYNMGSQMRAEEKGNRNSAQYMLSLATKSAYIHYYEKDLETNELTHIFMAHPEAVMMYRTYHTVALIDSTYKTNRYSLPLVQLIGVTPVGMSFTIAYAILMGESCDCYSGTLDKLKTLLPDATVPNVIVTDRELGLMKAIEQVFPYPYSHHFLCVWHVNRAVETKMTNSYPGDIGRNIASKYWYKVVQSQTEPQLFERWTLCVENSSNLGDYLLENWFDHVKKFVKCYTNKVRHYGNTATSRVESSHSSLKNWLRSSTLALDTLWLRFHALLEQQHVPIRNLLQKSRSTQLQDHHKLLFSLLKCNVVHKAIMLMMDEYNRGTMLGVRLQDDCGCAIVDTHGLLCACKLHDLETRGKRVHLKDIDVFWKTLTYGDSVPVTDDAHLDHFINILRQRSPFDRARLEDYLHKGLFSEDDIIFEPKVKQNPKGRPKGRSNREKSGFEHARKKSKTPKKRKTSSTPIFTSFSAAIGAPLEVNYCTEPLFNFEEYFPSELVLYLDGWYNPKGDGHCRFRVLSHAVRGQEDHFTTMQTMLIDEIRKEFYHNLYGDQYREAFDRIRCLSQNPVNKPYWMENTDCYGFATHFNWVICIISSRVRNDRRRTWDNSTTYLPLRAEHGVHSPYGVLHILLANDHYMWVHLKPGYPISPLCLMWRRAKHDSVQHYPVLYEQQFLDWNME